MTPRRRRLITAVVYPAKQGTNVLRRSQRLFLSRDPQGPEGALQRRSTTDTRELDIRWHAIEISGKLAAWVSPDERGQRLAIDLWH
jgi:hypothetical protein